MDQIRVRHTFIVGLRNAHALEHQALALSDRQVEHLAPYAEVESRLRGHRGETEAQIARLERILDSLGESHSAIKDAALGLMGTLTALGQTLAPDEILKNSFANFAFENFEIAAYNSLITIAELGGFPGLVSGLQANLDEEVAMAKWLEANLRQTTIKFANLKEAGQTAKV